MRLRHFAVAGLLLILGLAGGGGCTRGALPPPPDSQDLKPGHFLREYFAAPGFHPEACAYALAAFELKEAKGVEADLFLPLFQEELTRAWEANGLKTSGPQLNCRLTGTIYQVSLSGDVLRFLRGRASAEIAVSGTITRDSQVVFAFRDRLIRESPVNPGPPSPKEKELLLRSLARSFAHRLLDELFLHGTTDDSG